MRQTTVNSDLMTPTKIKLRKEDGSLSLEYNDGSHFYFTAEYLRVHSPSAEVRGHGEGQEVLQYGKKDVKIVSITPTGNYAIQLHFNDDHNTGIFSWDYLRELGENQTANWETYLEKLQQEGRHRDAELQVVQLVSPKQD